MARVEVVLEGDASKGKRNAKMILAMGIALVLTLSLFVPSFTLYVDHSMEPEAREEAEVSAPPTGYGEDPMFKAGYELRPVNVYL